MTPRRFPPPWTIDEASNACFIVRDNMGQVLGYFYFEDEPGRRSAAKLLRASDEDLSERVDGLRIVKSDIARLPGRGPRQYPP